MGHRRILFVHGLDQSCRARDVAYEFERYGRIIRCDIPAPRPSARSSYAFVEFESARDAEDAYYGLHGKRFNGGVFKIQWAKRPPRMRDERDRKRSRSPARSRSPIRSPRRSRSLSRSPLRSPSPLRGSMDMNTRSPIQNGANSPTSEDNNI